MAEANRVLTEFRGRFIGKVSPVHFFWGAFDLAVTRFSGRRAPPHPGAPNMARFVAVEAYSHEVSSCGFWPGGGPVNEPAFYAYAYPEPQGFKDYPIQPQEAFYHKEMGEFLIPYDVEVSVNHSVLYGSAKILDFYESSYMNRQMKVETSQYEQTEQKVKIFTSMMIGDIEVKRV